MLISSSTFCSDWLPFVRGRFEQQVGGAYLPEMAI